MKGAITLVAIIEPPAGSFLHQRLCDELEQLVGVDHTGDRQDYDRNGRAQQPVAQLQQVGDQRAFGQRLRITARFAHAGSVVQVAVQWE